MAQFVSLNAAADYLGNGAIFLPQFQPEITDLVRRAGVLGQRIQYVPATGSPSRWFDQLSIQDGGFTDPRSIAPTAVSPTRVEKSLIIKAITSRIDYSLFDLEVTAQQGVFNELKAKDLKDMVAGILRLRDKNLWNGADTVSGNQVGSGTYTGNGLQYVGLLNQITQTTTIGSGASIIDGIRNQVAQMMANQNFAVRPTAIYIHPIALDYLEQEAKNANNAQGFFQNGVEVVPGVRVNGIATQAGILPLIPEPFLPVDHTVFGNPTSGHNYPFAIVTEDLIEYHYVGSKEPRVFMLGTTSNLNESYVGIMFGAPVVKMANVAHVIGAINRS